MVKCYGCPAKGIIRRPKTGQPICRECFFAAFEAEIHQTIVQGNLFRPGQRVAIAASGGKDSTVLAYIMKTLNERHGYGLDLFLLSVDEGIRGYRDDSLATVARNRDDYGLPLRVVTYADLYGWTMDEIVGRIGKKGNCTFCGVFRRQALDRGAAMLGVDAIVTGHNADDIAETVLMNLLRGDISRLGRCTNISTFDFEGGGVSDPDQDVHQFHTVPRSKPLKYTYEKEIVMYAYFRRLLYFSTECTYAPNAYRGHARAFLKDLEAVKPAVILDIVRSGEAFGDVGRLRVDTKRPTQMHCQRCGYIASNNLCKACLLLSELGSKVVDK